MKFFKYVIFFLLLVFLSACVKEKPAPIPVTDQPIQENNQTKEVTLSTTKEKTNYTLLVKTKQKDTRIRILNIKPKYHDNIELKPGKYLIEVTKKGYQKYKKWIDIKEDFILNVNLVQNKNPYDTKYFKYVSEIEWKNHHDIFALRYDKKTKLIWGLQSAYVDYAEQKRLRKILKDTLYAKGTPWPKIYEAKIDTLIYTGYFRYRGRNFLFKNKNSVTLYKAGKKKQQGKIVAHLSRLETNSMVNYWRLPKEEELLISNPFKTYQKYFQVKYSRYKEIHFNLPVLCTKLKKGSFYSNCSVSYAYNKKSGMYDGKRIDPLEEKDVKEGLYFALNHAKNFALVMPVRAVSSQYDKIIFDSRITSEQKLAALTTLLITEVLEHKKQKVQNIANKMASKAMHMLYGDPKISGHRLYSATNDFARRVKNSKRLRSVAKASFIVKNEKLYLRTLQ